MMASRRYLKKKINAVVNNIVEECYSVQIVNNEKEGETNKIIDEAVNMFDDLLSRLQDIKTEEDNKKRKKLYKDIDDELEKNSLKLLSKLEKV